MANKRRFIIGAICIPFFLGAINLLDTHPNWAYALFTLAGISFIWGIWGIWPLILRKRLSAERPVETVTGHSMVLTGEDKSEIRVLMELVNSLEDKMNQSFNESLCCAGDRVAKYQSLLESPDFSGLWNKYLLQRAKMSIISPELEDYVRKLLSLIRGSQENTLSKQYKDQLPELSKQLDEQASAIEANRRGIRHTIEKLIG